MIKLNEVLVVPTIFPDRTSQVWHLENLHKRSLIQWTFEDEGEFLHVAQIVALLKAKHPTGTIHLCMSYLPYGRQDKEVSNETTFALRPFLDLLKSLRVSKISVIDAHSNLAENYLDNFENIYPGVHIARAIGQLGNITRIAFPDEGAATRHLREAKQPILREKYHGQFITGEKRRDSSTGEITGMTLEGSPIGQHILIVDDICDGGATFVAFATLLKKYGASSVSLYVTHGIFSKGVQRLREAGIHRIFTRKGEII